MTKLLMRLANGRIILALEGGYNLKSTASSMAMCTKMLLGDPLPPISLKEVMSKSALYSIRSVISAHSQYWTAFAPFQERPPTISQISKRSYLAVNKENESNEKVSTSTSSSASTSTAPGNMQQGEVGKGPRIFLAVSKKSTKFNGLDSGRECRPGLSNGVPKLFDLDQENSPGTLNIVPNQPPALTEINQGNLYEPVTSGVDEWRKLQYDEMDQETPELVVVQTEIDVSGSSGYLNLKTSTKTLVPESEFGHFIASDREHSPTEPVSTDSNVELIDPGYGNSHNQYALESEQVLIPRHEDPPEAVTLMTPQNQGKRGHADPNNTSKVMDTASFEHWSKIYRIKMLKSAGTPQFVKIEEYSKESGIIVSKRLRLGRSRPLRFHCSLISCRDGDSTKSPQLYASIEDLICRHYDLYHNEDNPRRCISCSMFFHSQELLDEHFKVCPLQALCQQLSDLHINVNSWF